MNSNQERTKSILGCQQAIGLYAPSVKTALTTLYGLYPALLEDPLLHRAVDRLIVNGSAYHRRVFESFTLSEAREFTAADLEGARFHFFNRRAGAYPVGMLKRDHDALVQRERQGRAEEDADVSAHAAATRFHLQLCAHLWVHRAKIATLPFNAGQHTAPKRDEEPPSFTRHLRLILGGGAS